ncbi:TKL protein kinase, variant [Phytophthora nicotianae CJ01A1]|uniref:non-specific serine/threonine protein kinase n=2 Tax=Phytophthora nicotianae TaxID=4792 RepID=W2KZX9_PHYNI|nr:TKL protein kinase [Phytophthora nicotianae]ETP13289.1 TKL protein kinase [Phytophthora nicotianae CJ01A1]ETK83548.1 TKL protein kinase, variant [Phytophthora nicotianae]ETL36961.1 TKL protein kinase [Phytophthora nicotianae]ETL36962.1 TKL protein kinase, variant [Phytophthora nicotianae]
MRLWGTLALGLLSDAVFAASSSGSSTSATSGTLNTLTTSCNGGCSSNGACVVVGQSSANSINCVNDTSCVTLSSGQSALCLDAFSSSATEWVFQPAESNDTAGVGPFERVGLLQLDDHVTGLTFRKADQGEEPLSGSLQLASMNIQPDAILDTVTFQNLSLSGLDSALPLNSVKRIYVNNCSLSEIPTAAVAGDSVTVIDLAGNAITKVDTNFQEETFSNLTLLDLSSNALTEFDLVPENFPAITTLYLHGNSLMTVPNVIFNLGTLQYLTLIDNPINASDLTAQQFTFLANLEVFSIDGMTNTSACPTTAVQSTLNDSFTFCVGNDDGNLNSTVTEEPATTVPATTEDDSSSSSSNKTWVILGACLGAVVLLLLIGLVWWCCRRRRNEQPKLTNSTIPSIAIGMGDMSDHPYMELGVPRSNASSQTTSDFELLASVADGYIGLTRLSYDDVFLHKMLRVSSRSELWLGEYKHEAVLIKKIKSNTASKALMRDFVTEIELMFELKHPRIAAFKGAMWDADGTELCAVVEYVEKGALRDCTVNNAIELSVPKQHAIARQISEAMAFLHKQKIVHGRLNAFNVLLDKDYSAKLSLFSIFHYVKLSPLDNECKIFVAPEILRGEQPSERSDVYAFGVVLVEIDTGETPVMNARKLSMERSGREDGLSPTAKKVGFRMSRQCSGVMKDVITACLEKDPARRPSMAEVVLAFKNGAMKL